MLAPVVTYSSKIRRFKKGAAFEAWMAKHPTHRPPIQAIRRGERGLPLALVTPRWDRMHKLICVLARLKGALRCTYLWFHVPPVSATIA